MTGIKKRDLLYFCPLLIPIAAWWSLAIGGYLSWLTPFVIFGILPFIEQWAKPDVANYHTPEEQSREKQALFTILLFLNVPLIYAVFYQFAHQFTQKHFQWWELMGLVISLGIVLGANGINVAHELGHRNDKLSRLAAFLLLLPSNYVHFTLEHNLGHHKNVATPQDPATASRGQNVYAFWLQSIMGTYLHSWSLQMQLLKQQKKSFFNLSNQIFYGNLTMLIFNILLFMIFGGFTWLLLFFAGMIGVLLLETINYIEHYGLLRKKMPNGRYETVTPEHSWNSDHIIGRILLYELTRHSDHHFKSSRAYQILRHVDYSPQLPVGYPGAMLISLCPPLWFRLMDRRLQISNEIADSN
jgi:alkane 1-monooxygenase